MTEQGARNRVLVALVITLALATAGKGTWAERPILDVHVGWTNDIHVDDTYVYLGQNTGVLKLLDKTNDTQFARELSGRYEHSSHVTVVAADEGYVFTGSPDKSVVVREKAYNLVMIAMLTLFKSEIESIALDDSYLYVVTATDDIIYAFNRTKGYILPERIGLGVKGDILADGDRIYACDGHSSEVHVMDPHNDFKDVIVINQTECPVNMFTDDKYLYLVPPSGGDPRGIRVYDKNVGYQPVTTLSGHGARITEVFADERYLYSASHDGKVRVWAKNESFAQVAELNNGAGVQSLFVDDGRVYAGLVNRSLLVWEKPVRTPSPFGYKGSLMCDDGYCGVHQGECLACANDCTLEECLGNERCDIEIGENCASAPGDCSCLPSEVCIPVRTRSRGLGCYNVTCGDGNCDPGENKTNCFPDCGCERGFYYYNGKCVPMPEQPTPEPTPTPSPTPAPNVTTAMNGTEAILPPNATMVPGAANATDANGTAPLANVTPDPGIIVPFNTTTSEPVNDTANVTTNVTTEGDDLDGEGTSGVPQVLVAVLGSVVLAGSGYWATRLRGAEDPKAVVAADVQRVRDKVRSLVPSRGGTAPTEVEEAVQPAAPRVSSAAVTAAPTLDIDAGLDEVAAHVPATGPDSGADLDLDDMITELE